MLDSAVAGATPAGPDVPFWRHQDVHDRRREGGAGYGRADSFSMSAMGRPVISAMSVIDDNDFYACIRPDPRYKLAIVSGERPVHFAIWAAETPSASILRAVDLRPSLRPSSNPSCLAA